MLPSLRGCHSALHAAGPPFLTSLRFLSFAIAILIFHAPARGADSSGQEQPFREVPVLNAGLPATGPRPTLDTPQSLMESFFDAYQRHDEALAAACLNLNAIRPEDQTVLGPRLARQLAEVLDQICWDGWGSLPDRVDGMADLEAGTPRSKDQPDPQPHSNILLRRVSLGRADAEVRIERVRAPETNPVWVVSERTVAHIPELYRLYSKTWLQHHLPPFLERTHVMGVSLWNAIAVPGIIALGTLAVSRILELFCRLLAALKAYRAIEIVNHLRDPGSLLAGLTLTNLLADRSLIVSRASILGLKAIVALVMTVSVVWFLHRAVSLVGDWIIRRCREQGRDCGRLVTQVAMGRHALTLLFVTVGAIHTLKQFDWFQQLGMALLASAGVAGLVLGVAAQRLLGNLFAGILLAANQPVRAGDAILFEGNFGWIEELATTYLVIRSWDLRRIVVPLGYFLDKPFQNWSRQSQQLMMPVYIYTDYRVSVEDLREEFRKVLESSPDWDRSFKPILQVTGCGNGMLELRGLCGAGSPEASWNLQCLVRERLVTYLKGLDGGVYLPRTRIQFVRDSDARADAKDVKDAVHDQPNGQDCSGPARVLPPPRAHPDQPPPQNAGNPLAPQDGPSPNSHHAPEAEAARPG
jgi:small-conductance mechanosensitive channel